MPLFGPHTVTVPGTARGWEATVDRFGTMGLADCLDPAIRLALEGYPVTEVVSDQWQHAETLFDDDHARDAYLFDGQAPDVGQTVTLPALGRTMQRIADEGADVVYEGEIADAIASEVRDAGGYMTVEDLADFAVEWPDPLSSTYAGAEVFELGPQNQGQIVLEALNVAAEIGAGDHPYDSADRVHAFVEAIKVAFRDGHHYITDPEFEPVKARHASVTTRCRTFPSAIREPTRTATPSSCPSPTTPATWSPSSTRGSRASAAASSPATPGLPSRTAAGRFRCRRTTPTASNPASGPSTR
jgi:gamma-glutamyltranspeptidase/glutathione hydrolase